MISSDGPSNVQGDDEPPRYHDGRHPQLPPAVPAVHSVQQHQREQQGGDVIRNSTVDVDLS